MGHKCFISFKYHDVDYKNEISKMNIDMIDKSLDKAINSIDEDYIMRKIREDYLSDSTVTIHLIGEHSAENSDCDQTYIKRELQASLYNGKGNTRSGILGVVLPSMIHKIYGGTYKCNTCGETHNYWFINNNTTIREFNYNYYIPKDSGCCWRKEDRYCILSKWDEFISNPESYINLAYDKRSESIANRVKVYPDR